jgi:hypothetical protein
MHLKFSQWTIDGEDRVGNSLTIASNKIVEYFLTDRERVEQPQSVTLFSASPDSPMSQLIAKHGPSLIAQGVHMRVIFANSQNDVNLRNFARCDSPGAGTSALSEQSPRTVLEGDFVRWVEPSVYLRCHEQLVLGDITYLSGDTVAEMLGGNKPGELHVTSKERDIVAAKFAFEMLWHAANPREYIEKGESQRLLVSARRSAAEGTFLRRLLSLWR